MRSANTSDAAIIEYYLDWIESNSGNDPLSYRYAIKRDLSVSYALSERVIEAYKNQQALISDHPEHKINKMKSRAVELISPLIDEIEKDYKKREDYLKSKHLDELKQARRNREDLISQLESIESLYHDKSKQLEAKEEALSLSTQTTGELKSRLKQLENDKLESSEKNSTLNANNHDLEQKLSKHAQTILDLHEQHRKERQHTQDQTNQSHAELRKQIQHYLEEIHSLKKDQANQNTEKLRPLLPCL